MSRIHDERTDLFSREGVLTSTTNIRSIHSLSQTMEKEKAEKSSFNQHSFDSGFRTIDLIKPTAKLPQGRTIAPASLGSTHLHTMPPLMPSYISGSLVRGSTAQHAFPTHIPINIGVTAAAIAPSRGSVTMSQRTSLLSLKANNSSNQIQVPMSQVSGLPTILPPTGTNRTGSPIVTSHGLSSDSRLDSRPSLLSDPHHSLRGNIPASGQHSGQATIQVIASGTAAQQSHIPTSFLSKGMTINAAPNKLKIGVTAHSNSTSLSTSTAASAFKLGIGKPFPGSSSVIIPAPGTNVKSDLHDVRHNSVTGLAYSRFSTAPSHLIQAHTTLIATTTNSLTTTTTAAAESRSQTAVGVPFHPVSGAYVFHELGHPIGLHTFPHQIIRPTATTVGSLPMFTLDSQRTIPAVPVVSLAVSTISSSTDPSDPSKSEGLTIHGNTSFNISNIYANLQTSIFTPTFSSVSNIDSSARPSILRKRPAETSTLFPVHPTEKERISSPLKIDNSPANILQAKMINSPNLISNEKIKDTPQKSINHSILSITSDLKEYLPDQIKPLENCVSIDASVAAQQSLLTSAMTAALNTNNNLPEVSPKKKPRKQLIITTEDKYGSTAPINSMNPVTTSLPSLLVVPQDVSVIPAATTYTMDEDEEFLKSNETMKDITPPKLPVPLHAQFQSSQVHSKTVNSHAKRLFSPITVTSPTFQKPPKCSGQELTESLANGIVQSPLAEIASAEIAKYVIHRRPQISILNDYKVNSKAAHNHFYRYSDVKIKEEKKNHDRNLTKSSLESVTGWRIQHLSTQLDDMMSLEKEICDEMLKCKDTIPLPKLNSPSDLFHDNSLKLSEEDLHLQSLHELLQGNIQRCQCSIEQLEETKQLMLRLLDHKPKALELIKTYKKPRFKKKQT